MNNPVPKFRDVGITLKVPLVDGMVILQVTHITHHSWVCVLLRGKSLN